MEPPALDAGDSGGAVPVVASPPSAMRSGRRSPSPPSRTGLAASSGGPLKGQSSTRLKAIHYAAAEARELEFEAEELEAERRDRDARCGALALKLSMFTVMLIAGALGGYFAYILGYDAELANFENQYYASVSQLQYSVQRGLSAKAGAGALAAAYFASAGSNFPNASYPGWNAIAYNLNIVAQVRGIAWLPYVTPAQLPGFQAFANSSIGVQWANATLQQCGFVNATDFAAGVATVTRNVQGGLFAGNASVHKPINASAAYYFPLIHHAPIHTNEPVIMFDLNSEAVRARAIAHVLATKAAATTDWLRLVQDVNANQNRIASLALTPVIVDGVVVGISNTVFNWDSVLLQALPSFISGIDAVLSSGLSNRTFTMRLAGSGSVQGIGVGDLHETDADLAQYTRTISATLGTTWTITLHPTRALMDSYFTTGPRDRCIAVLVVIIICIFLFILHDWLARSRSMTLIRLVKATSRIVDDLFPRTVRSRLVKAALAEDAPEVEVTAPLSQGATKALGLIQKYIGIEAAQTQAVARRSSVLVAETGAIADTFPAVTVLFSDIVGFTAWSATVPPEAVFRVLGAMFAEFDALAHACGTYKVETIGDAYMCVCGLPTQTSAHAERMADFALGMFSAVQRACEVTGANLQIRVGMHSGTVTAGVLLGERSRFQLFGDTVNTASRMESTGAAGRVQVSATTARLLQDTGVHALEYRGKVSAKGKGEMDTYWLLSRTSGTPYRAAVPDRRSSALGGFGLGRRHSMLSNARSSAASSRSSAVGSGISEHLAGVAVEAGDSTRSGSRQGSYRETEPRSGSPLRRAHTAPTGSPQLAVTDEAL